MYIYRRESAPAHPSPPAHPTSPPFPCAYLRTSVARRLSWLRRFIYSQSGTSQGSFHLCCVYTAAMPPRKKNTKKKTRREKQRDYEKRRQAKGLRRVRMSEEKYNEMLSQSESLRLLKDENQKLEDKRRAMEDESGRLRTGLDAARQQMQSVQSKLLSSKMKTIACIRGWTTSGSSFDPPPGRCRSAKRIFVWSGPSVACKKSVGQRSQHNIKP